MACDIKPEFLQDMPTNDVIGTNGTSHTTIETITSGNAEQSDESNMEAPAAAEQLEADAVGEGEKPQKPANGELLNEGSIELLAD